MSCSTSSGLADVDDDRPRIQVKCSGKRLPMHPISRAKAEWSLKPPTKGIDAHAELGNNRLGLGHHCDLFVLARHEGLDIKRGWSFYVLRADVQPPPVSKLKLAPARPCRRTPE